MVKGPPQLHLIVPAPRDPVQLELELVVKRPPAQPLSRPLKEIVDDLMRGMVQSLNASAKASGER